MSHHSLTIFRTSFRILTSRDSDISNAQAMSSLHISQPHLRQQPQEPAQSTYAAAPLSQPPSQPPTPVHTARPVDPAPPLTAPQPVRAPVAPPPVSTPGMPGMWSPEMGIRFGSAAIPPGANPAPAAAPAPAQTLPKPTRGPQPGIWDPSQGLRFS
jgi:programmed cell death 6-interacting protein